MPKRTSDFSSWELEKLSDPVLAARYLTAILEEAPEQFIAGIGNVARAHQITSIAEQTGRARETLYRSLSEEGNPTWKMLSAVMKALHVKFKGIEEATVNASPSSQNPQAANRVTSYRKTRAGSSRHKRSYSTKSEQQLTLAFPQENANAINAGTSTRLSQSSVPSKASSIIDIIPSQQGRRERDRLVFNAMLASIVQGNETPWGEQI